MGKRGEKHERSPRDLYETVDPRAGKALAPHLKPGTRFVEPCAGGGALIDQLVGLGHVLHYACDIHPLRDGIAWNNALEVERVREGVEVITNPPFVRPLMHSIMWHFTKKAPAWYLVEADWLMTQQATELIAKHGADIVAVGRLRWFREGDPRDKGNDPMDNFAWLRLEPDPFGAPRFWPRRV